MTRANIGQVRGGLRVLPFMQVDVFIIRTANPRERWARWAEGCFYLEVVSQAREIIKGELLNLENAPKPLTFQWPKSGEMGAAPCGDKGERKVIKRQELFTAGPSLTRLCSKPSVITRFLISTDPTKKKKKFPSSSPLIRSFLLQPLSTSPRPPSAHNSLQQTRS